jgi:uncharacterized protein YndB with AHSA1/START domain
MTNLATFIDRYTMRHVRIYPHPVDRVWRALTDEAEINQWFGFPVKLDMRIGGICEWGPDGSFYQTRVSKLEPKTLIEHAGVDPNDEGYQRFELSEHPDGCRFDFTHHFAPAASFEEDRTQAGGDLPGGPDTPWRPGFVGGFHGIWDNLGRFLDDEPVDPGDAPSSTSVREVIDSWLWRNVEAFKEIDRETAERYRKELYNVARWNELNEIYREHIKNTIPSE